MIIQSELERKIHTETDLNSYKDYIPEDWGVKTLGSTPQGTVLESLVINLALTWRSVSYTAQMPATAIRAIYATALGRSKFVSPDTSILGYSEAIILKLCERVPELIVQQALKNRILAELVTVSSNFRDDIAKVNHEVPVESIWNDFMSDVAFRLSLWASQRVAYSAFYNAYEAFLVDSLKVATGATSLRSTDKKTFNEAMRSCLGKDITGGCWAHHEINIARLVRHALSHNGGRVTEELSKQKHGVMVIDSDLQIVPDDIHRMLKRLRKAVDEIIEAARELPKFLEADQLSKT